MEIVGIIFIVGAVIYALLGFRSVAKNRVKNSKWLTVTGKYTNTTEQRSPFGSTRRRDIEDDTDSSTWLCQYSFVANNGNTYTGSHTMNHDVGLKKVKIVYNPNNPNENSVKNSSTLLGCITVVMTLLLLGIGAVILVISSSMDKTVQM